jgi:hypothetical protein
LTLIIIYAITKEFPIYSHIIMKQLKTTTLLFSLLFLTSCTTTRILTIVPNLEELTASHIKEVKDEPVVNEETKTDVLNPDDLNGNDLFKLSDIQDYNIGKWKSATADDFGFNPNSNPNLLKVSEGSNTAWLIAPKKSYLSYKSNKDNKVTYIIPSQVLTDEYLKNPFNIVALIGSLCEGHGSWNGKVFVFNPNVAKHQDPGSNKGEYKFNSGLFSGQNTPKTGAQASIFALNGNNSDLKSQLSVFKKGYYIDATREYNPQMIEGLKRHGIWNKKLSIPAFANVMDTFVQNGTGLIEGHKTNLFLKTYFKIKSYNRAQIIAFLRSKRVDSSDLDGGFEQMDTESLKIFAARMNVFVDSKITRKEFCFNQAYCGMGRVNDGQKSKRPALTWTATVANDQFRRQQAVINIVSFKDLQNLANAKISAIPDGK